MYKLVCRTCGAEWSLNGDDTGLCDWLANHDLVDILNVIKDEEKSGE